MTREIACSFTALNRFHPFSLVWHNRSTLANNSVLIFSAVSLLSSLLLFSITPRYLYPWVPSIIIASASHTGEFVADLDLFISSSTTARNLLVSSTRLLRSPSLSARSLRSSTK
ncbi:hypothetical protein NUSPORA_02860a, partial [Nucleospora cyclopteri]